MSGAIGVKEVVQDDANVFQANYCAQHWAVRLKMNNRMSDAYEQICISLALLTTFLRICAFLFIVCLTFLGLNF